MRVGPMSQLPISSPRSAVQAPAHLRLQTTGAGLTDRGKERSSNQDRFLVAPFSGDGERGCLLAVADGIGGAWGGETASALAMGTVERVSLPALRVLVAQPAPDRARLTEELGALFHDADRRLTEEIARRPALRGMATTLTVGMAIGRRLFLGHVGDSRCYLVRGGALQRLTHDQTVAEEMMRIGLLTPEVAALHPYRNVLTDFVGGGDSKLHIQVRETDLCGGDELLLCSHGLTSIVPEDVILAIVLGAPTPERACERLVARANELGGQDDVTAVVARCELVP